MCADELDRRVESVRVLTLVGAVEVLGDLLDRCRVDLSVRKLHFDAVLLVLVAKVAVAEEAHLLCRDPLAREHL